MDVNANAPAAAADSTELIRRAMSILGRRTSERKRAACIRNARRPRKRHKRKANGAGKSRANSNS